MDRVIDETAAEAAMQELDRLRTEREGPEYLIKKLDVLLASRRREVHRPGRYLINEVP
jgi:hypothetical protein